MKIFYSLALAATITFGLQGMHHTSSPKKSPQKQQAIATPEELPPVEQCPDEILLHIFGQPDLVSTEEGLRSIGALRATSTRFQRLLKDKQLKTVLTRNLRAAHILLTPPQIATIVNGTITYARAYKAHQERELIAGGGIKRTHRAMKKLPLFSDPLVTRIVHGDVFHTALLLKLPVTSAYLATVNIEATLAVSEQYRMCASQRGTRKRIHFDEEPLETDPEHQRETVLEEERSARVQRCLALLQAKKV